MNKKVILLQHFKSYIEGNSAFKPIATDSVKKVPTVPTKADVEKCVYLKRWKQNDKAIVLKTSNNLAQVLFHDKSEIILQFATSLVSCVPTVTSKDVKNGFSMTIT